VPDNGQINLAPRNTPKTTSCRWP